MKFSDMVTESVLLRAVSIIVLGYAMLAAVTVAMVDLMTGREVPSIIVTLIATGLTMAGTIAGINFGLILQVVKKPAPQTVTPPQPVEPPESLSPPTAKP